MKSLQALCMATFLLLSLVGSGCSEPLDPDKPVSEFPARALQDYRSRGGAILVLCKWEPDTSPEARATLAATHDKGTLERATVIRQVSIDDGEIAGFRRRGDDLFAIAGTTRIPLSPGHYTWQLLTQDPRGHHSSDSPVVSDDAGLTNGIRDDVKSLDNKYNGQFRKEHDLPTPDLGN